MEKAEGYDAIAPAKAVHPDVVEAQLSFVRSFTDAELAASRSRFGDLRRGFTVIGGSKGVRGGAGYAPELCEGNPLLVGRVVIIRAYRGAPELLPKDFEWGPVPGTVDLLGGRLKDAAKRL